MDESRDSKALRRVVTAAVFVGVASQLLQGQVVRAPVVKGKWVTIIESAAGTTPRARDQAVAAALRKAVEQSCGVFLKAQSQTSRYKLVYDKIFANTVGFVREHQVVRTWMRDGKTFAKIRALVSTQKFEKNWAAIAHTIHRAGNPRVIVAVAETTRWTRNGWEYGLSKIKENGIVQSGMEDFFLGKSIVLMDRKAGKAVSKRDVLLAGLRDDTKAIAAIGARFKADVVVTGKANAKYSRTITVSDTSMHQYVGNLTLRAVETDSARVLASKTFRATATTLHRGAGAEKALAKLAEEAAPKFLAALVEAWRKRVHVSRSVQLRIARMEFPAWLKFKREVSAIRGIRALHLREITEGFANISAEYEYKAELLAEQLMGLKSIRLKVKELTPNRIRLEVAKDKAPSVGGGSGG